MGGAHWVSAAFGLTAVISSISPSFGGPAVASRWQNANITQETCLRRAEEAIRRTGLGNLERTEQSRYGTRDDYTGVVRCITSNGLAVFIGSGPSRAIADRLAGTLFQNFSTEGR